MNLSGSIDDPALNSFFDLREPRKVLLVVITSDRGLCGAFNANVIKRTNQLIREKYAQQVLKSHITILPIGKKGYEFYSRSNYKVDDRFREIFQNSECECCI